MRFLHLCLLAYWLAAGGIAPAQERRESPCFKTPAETFTAYREALAKGDWRDVCSCHSEEARQEMLFEAYFGCSMQLGGDQQEEAVKLLKAYGLESSLVDAACARRIQAEETRDAKRLTGERRGAVFKEILSDLIDDEAGFIAATQEMLGHPELNPVVGQLEGVQLDGDRAEGKAPTTTYWLMAENGGPTKRQGSTNLKTYRFRKVGDSWFIDP